MTKNQKKEVGYSVEAMISGQTFRAKGKTVLECLDKIHPEILVKGKGTLTVKRGSKTRDMILYPFLIRRFLVNRVYRQILDKRFTLALQ